MYNYLLMTESKNKNFIDAVKYSFKLLNDVSVEIFIKSITITSVTIINIGKVTLTHLKNNNHNEYLFHKKIEINFLREVT